MDDFVEVSAYHEAGHAVMAIVVGGSVRQITLEPDWDDGPDRFADIQVEWAIDKFGEQEIQECYVQVALAGPVAEMIYTGDPFHPGFLSEWRSDWQAAWQAAAPLFPSPPLRITYLERMTATLYQLLRRDTNWQAIAVLADHLQAHETLDGEMVLEAVSPWLGHR